MKTNCINPERRTQGAAIVWILFMLYVCRDSIFNSRVFGFYASYFAQFAAAIVMTVSMLVIYRKKPKELFSDNRILLAAVFSVLILLPMILKRDFQFMYFSILFAVLVSVLASFLWDYKMMAQCYIYVITILACLSLLNAYGLRFAADAGIVNAVQVDGFYNFYGSFVPISELKWRNFGIFREPGVYQFFIILGLYLNNDVVYRQGGKGIWIINGILAAAMLSTLSFAGIAELALLIVVLFFSQGWHKKRSAWILAAVSVAVLVIAYNVIHWLDGPLWGEIWMLKHKFSNGGESVTDRFGSIYVNMKMFLSSPIIGVNEVDILYNPEIENNTSSTTILLAMLGAFGGLAHILSWLVFTWKKERCFVFNLLFAIILAMAFNTENLIADLFFWLFPIMAVCDKALPKKGTGCDISSGAL